MIERDVVGKGRRAARCESMLERVDVWEVRPNWRDYRGCAGQPVDWWYGGGRPWQLKGAAICDACQVRMDCLVDAVRQERQVPSIEDVAGHRCVPAYVRRDFLSKERKASL